MPGCHRKASVIGVAAMIDDRQFTDEWTASLRHLRAFGMSLCRDPLRIDDLMQQTALQAWAARQQFRGDGCSVRSWLFTILRNCYLRELRSPRCVEDPDGAIAIAVSPIVYNQDFRLQLAELDRGMQALSSVQREALTLVALRGFSYEEVGSICQRKAGTIKTRVTRARATLRRFLDGSAGESSAPSPRRAATDAYVPLYDQVTELTVPDAGSDHASNRRRHAESDMVSLAKTMSGAGSARERTRSSRGL